ncbi:MAG: hypothetical protein ACE5G8_05795 [Anaerolineae bacterium]
MFSKKWRNLACFALLPALVSLACGLGSAATEKVQQQAEEVAGQVEQKVEEVATQAATAVTEAQDAAGAAATQAAAAVEEVQQTVEEQQAAQPQQSGGETQPAADAAEEATIEFNSIDATLANFTSYRTQLVMTYEGTTSSGTPTAGKIDVLTEQTKEPPALHMTMRVEGDTVAEMGGQGLVEVYTVGDTTYLQNPEDGSWMSFSGGGAEDAFGGGFLSADELVDIPKTARRSLLPQTVNGISTWHYTFDESDIVDETTSLQSASGEMWVAVDGGYPVKFVMEATGSSMSEAEGELFESGSFKIEYELKDVNAGFTITPPEEALNAGGFFGGSGEETGQTDLPMLDDADVQFSMAGMVSYYTAAGVNQVVEFYRAQLPPLGWTADTSFEMVSDDGALLNFTKEGVELTLSVNREDDGRVNVSLFSGQ